MFFRSYTLRYAAVISLLAIFLVLSGLVIYTLWFSPPPAPPPRSQPVLGAPPPAQSFNIQRKGGRIWMTVAKVIELVGESKVSWDDAVRSAVKEAGKTVDNITGVEVLNMTANLDEGDVVEYKVNLKLAFGVRERR